MLMSSCGGMDESGVVIDNDAARNHIIEMTDKLSAARTIIVPTIYALSTDSSRALGPTARPQWPAMVVAVVEVIGDDDR